MDKLFIIQVRDLGGPGWPKPVDKCEGFGGRAGPGPVDKSEGLGAGLAHDRQIEVRG